ncbi:LysR family transcriptional regulator [Advenella mimigardefordensis]|uniref:Transcriptional regulator, LysR family n=1 Tax=Advenella mimigardefordensis (strain DSM 17166 / LMG 22922 / DPN7) TaxID=1247726 RepID=W0PGV3_ADVMD|nr:LysR family transcriptional regulator [Advenella mimigardefordensis]AHG64605.1 transcriptional regulator, LysR family [Advenella mimigardefordensis DPN7]
MQISDIQIFLSVASAGSLSAAGRQLDLTPMQVSRRLTALEADLGVRLFHRSTRSVSLTAEGHAFLPYANTMVDAEESARGTLSPSQTGATGVLRMTAPSIFGQSIVLPLLPGLLEQHPEMHIDLDLSDRVIDIVGQGLDLALRLAPLVDSELVAKKLTINPRIICAAPDYLQRYGHPAILSDLDSHYCILLQTIPRWPFLIDGIMQYRRMRGRFMTSSIQAVRDAAIQGLGLAMLTYWDVSEQLEDGSLIRVDLQDASMEELAVWAVTPTRRYVPTRVNVFLDALQSTFNRKYE